MKKRSSEPVEKTHEGEKKKFKQQKLTFSAQKSSSQNDAGS